MRDWKKWQQWDFAAEMLIFAIGFIYEWCWDPENWKLYAVLLGVLAVLAYPLWRLRRWELEKRSEPPSKWWALLTSAVCVVIFIVRCLGPKDTMRVPHITLLPWYIGFAIEGLVNFFVLWRWEKIYQAEYREKMAAGGSVWKNINMPKGK